MYVVCGYNGAFDPEVQELQPIDDTIKRALSVRTQIRQHNKKCVCAKCRQKTLQWFYHKIIFIMWCCQLLISATKILHTERSIWFQEGIVPALYTKPLNTWTSAFIQTSHWLTRHQGSIWVGVFFGKLQGSWVLNCVLSYQCWHNPLKCNIKAMIHVTYLFLETRSTCLNTRWQDETKAEITPTQTALW